MAITEFPNGAVCYILADIPGEGEFQASGVIIGPHTILTAAHELWDADAGAVADAVSIYPGFTPDTTTYNPPGALPGLQSVHTIKVPDNGGELSASGTQSDFAVIDTSADLSRFGQFALDTSFTGGDVIATGYPASNNGYQAGVESAVSVTAGFSNIDTSSLDVSPGFSGGPLWDKVERNGSLIPAVVGAVSTSDRAMKLTRAKVALIRHWIASDQSLYGGGTDAPRGITPQIAGTVVGDVDAAHVAGQTGSAALSAAVAPFTYADPGSPGLTSSSPVAPAVSGSLSELVQALHATPSGAGDGALSGAASIASATIAAPVIVFHPNQGFGTDR